LPQAHAVVFILGADTGVTKSDLSIWREHLIVDPDQSDVRLVVLNKIDTLWDALSSSAQVHAQIERQCSSHRGNSGHPRANVIPVSAQKGLVAKVTDDANLLAASCLPDLERALGRASWASARRSWAPWWRRAYRVCARRAGA
jgi:predicted GTPase